jgi:hypothetical protein
MLSGRSDRIVVYDIDLKNYAKYILKEGADIEKRELLGCLKGKITLSNKVICLISDADVT